MKLLLDDGDDDDFDLIVAVWVQNYSQKQVVTSFFFESIDKVPMHLHHFQAQEQEQDVYQEKKH